MEKISDYSILEKISETRNSIIYRAQKENESESVILKKLNTKSPTPSEIARFKQEYVLIKNLDNEDAIKIYDFLENDENFALVMEDFQGVSLKSLLKSKKFILKSFLQIGKKIANALGNLHKENIIHKDIKPHNILINTKTGKIKLIDFGISAILTHKDDELYNPDVIEGTLSYISPEQTGRMNRDVDYRTDIYSLGITLYEMLTGCLPFQSKDPLELIHSHIARNPVSPSEIDPDIPVVISDIIMKSISKTAEERYQNAHGLAADLTKCLNRLNSNKEIEKFALATKDISLKFNIPRILIGREKEIDLLMSSFARVSGSSELSSNSPDESSTSHTLNRAEIMIVAGRPGIGKTALIHEIHKPVVAKRGYFISGKYDQFRRDVPYSAIIQAFQMLINQILAETDDMINIWKQNLLEALGPNGRVVTDVIQAIELIIGSQPEIPDLGPEESQNRFNYVFKNFIRVFTKKEHPIVLFLDDLQWADSASFTLITMLITDYEMEYLYLIGAYRDNEVDSSHFLMHSLEKIKEMEIPVNRIFLDPLGLEDVNKLIANFLKCNNKYSKTLAELIYEKTAGNPFFVNQFLKNLYEKNMLTFNPSTGWLWNMNEINNLQVTDNVVDLLAEKIIELPERVKKLIEICACIGNRFDLETLSTVLESPFDAVLSNITTAIEEGLIGTYGKNYFFNHDRIQEAAYTLIPEKNKKMIHLKIGRLFLAKTDHEKLLDNIFYITGQLNHGIELLSNEKELYELAELNLLAGNKAKGSTAYGEAKKYLEVGIKLLPEDSWETKYELTLKMYTSTGEIMFLNGDTDIAEEYFDIVLTNTHTLYDTVKIYELKMDNFVATHEMSKSINLGFEILKLLGFNMPQKASKLIILKELVKAKLRIRNKNIEDLIELPQMIDEKKLLIARMLISCIPPIFFKSPEYLPVIALKLLNLSLKYGNSRYSAYAYSIYGIILCGVLGNIEDGYRFGILGKKMQNKFNLTELKSQIYFGIENMINPWKKNLKITALDLLEVYKTGIETGELPFASYAINHYLFQTFFSGESLIELQDKFKKYYYIIKNLKQEKAIHEFQLWYQIIIILMNEQETLTLIKGEFFNEDKLIPVMISKNDFTMLGYYTTGKLVLYYLNNEYEKAINIVEKGKKYFESMTGMIFVSEYNFYYSLSMLSVYAKADKKIKRRYLNRVKKNQKKMKKWAFHCSENFEHQYLLIEAVKTGLTGTMKETAELFDRAIDKAKQNGFTQDEAIANELAAKFWLAKNRKDFAALYMTKAYNSYKKWGAEFKVRQLKDKYSEFITYNIHESFSTDTETENNRHEGSSSGTPVTRNIDMISIMKSAQAISSEIELDKLLKIIMKLLIENAGAQKGFFILKNEEDNKLYIEASGKLDSKINVLQGIPLEQSSELSQSIANYVHKTMETIVLNNALENNIFSKDAYILKHQSKSIMCGPIMYKGTATGIIYIENNLTTNAFTPERLQVLQILSSQAAISIENSRLLSQRENIAKLKTEMEIAANIQTDLIPQNPAIEGFEITGYIEPADDVGGDYYDIINCGEFDWVIIGDVSGHGVPAGLVMMMVQTSIQTYTRRHPETTPSKLLEVVNETFRHNVSHMKEEKYMTITAFSFKKDGSASFSGQHQDLIIYRADTKNIEIIRSEGVWLSPWDIKRTGEDYKLKLNFGDILLLYTDGITEAFDSNDEMFGEKRLAGVLKEHGHLSTDSIKDAVLKDLKGYINDDDVTMLILKKL